MQHVIYESCTCFWEYVKLQKNSFRHIMTNFKTFFFELLKTPTATETGETIIFYTDIYTIVLKHEMFTFAYQKKRKKKISNIGKIQLMPLGNYMNCKFRIMFYQKV